MCYSEIIIANNQKQLYHEQKNQIIDGHSAAFRIMDMLATKHNGTRRRAHNHSLH